MQIIPLFSAKGIQVVSAVIPDLAELACRFSDAEYAELAEAASTEKRQREILASRLLARLLFGSQCRLLHRSSGMPYLDGMGADTPFVSISHCRETLVVAYGPVCRMGVDVEAASEKIVRVSSRIFSEREVAFAGDSLPMNALAWTAKEALYKAAGQMGLDFRSEIALDLAGVDAAAERNEYPAAVRGAAFRMISVRLGEKFVTLAFEE